MTENKKEIDLDIDKEIESLDEFLSESNTDEDDLKAFPLEDDFDQSFDEPKSKSMGKLLGTVAMIAILGGGLYFGMKALPNLMMDPALSEFEQNLQNRSEQFSQDITPAAPAESAPTTPPAMMDETAQQELPIPADAAPQVDGIDDLTIVDETADTPSAFGDENPVIESDVQTATNIAEIVEIAEEATEQAIIDESATPIVAEEDITNIEEEILPEVVEGIIADEETISPNLPTSFERVSARPLKETIQAAQEEAVEEPTTIEEIMPAVAEAEVEVAITPDEVAEVVKAIEEPAIIEPVAAIQEQTEVTPIENAIEEVVEENAALDEVIAQEPRAPIVEDTPPPAPEETLPTATIEEPQPAPEMVVANEPQKVEEQPMAVTPTKTETKAKAKTVKKKVVKKAAPKKLDPRVTQARQAYEQGDYQSALSLYQSVLASDKGNTAALTGLQLAKAKLRATTGAAPSQRVSMPEVITPLPATQTQTTPPTTTQTDGVIRDANTALQKAQEYHQAGQTSQAIEWYRKALQLDAIYKANINRMAVYDALADLQ